LWLVGEYFVYEVYEVNEANEVYGVYEEVIKIVLEIGVYGSSRKCENE